VFNILFTVINLLILLFFVKKFLFDKIDAIITKRQQEVDEATEAADKATQEAKAAKKEYEKKIALADEEKEQILSDIKKLGYEEYEKIVMDARKTGDKIVKEARQNARAEAEKERELHADELKDMVIDAAAKIAATKHSSEDDSMLYDKFINEARANNG
jgi:F-type H+-transporting ATPase subunit b